MTAVSQRRTTLAVLKYNYDMGLEVQSEFGYRSEDYFATPVSGEKNVKTMT